MSAGDKWVDHRAGPVVRPYALTAGRTEPAGGKRLDLISVVVATGAPDGGDVLGLTPEQRRILGLCGQPSTVADVAAATALPVGVVRVLLADLIDQGRVAVAPRQAPSDQPSADLLKEVLDGLRAL